MSELLNDDAVGAKTGPAAAEILQAYMMTGPLMAFSHAAPPATAPLKPATPG